MATNGENGIDGIDSQTQKHDDFFDDPPKGSNAAISPPPPSKDTLDDTPTENGTATAKPEEQEPMVNGQVDNNDESPKQTDAPQEKESENEQCETKDAEENDNEKDNAGEDGDGGLSDHCKGVGTEQQEVVDGEGSEQTKEAAVEADTGSSLDAEQAEKEADTAENDTQQTTVDVLDRQAEGEEAPQGDGNAVQEEQTRSKCRCLLLLLLT